MKLNTVFLDGEELKLVTKRQLSLSVEREFNKFDLQQNKGYFIYTFTPRPNVCFTLRHLINAYKDYLGVTKEAAMIIKRESDLATQPTLRMYKTDKHVEINCPPISHYLELVQVVGAAEKGLGKYTVPIARAFDVIRAADAKPSFLPTFKVDESIKNTAIRPVKGFDGTVASLFRTPIEEIHAVANAYQIKIENFNNAGYYSIADFLLTKPKRYIDKTQLSSFADLEEKEPVTFIGVIQSKRLINYKHAEFVIKIANTDFKVMFYNRTWIYDKFNVDDEVMVMGDYRGRMEIAGNALESMTEAKALDIVPIYAQSPKNNIKTKNVMNAVYEIIERLKSNNFTIAPYIRAEHLAMSVSRAVQELHFPTSSYRYIEALETLAFYELVYLQLLIQHKRATEVKHKGIPKPQKQGGYMDAGIAAFPYKLTEAQEKAKVELEKYLGSNTAEQILLTADVGAGKSTIAQIACFQALDNGYQSVLAGPTEILARQLYEGFLKTIKAMPEGKRPTIVFLGSKMKAAEKRDLHKAIKSGAINIIVGTHAVFSSSIEYHNLGLVCIDEQQKFGTAQRESLLSARNDGLMPDLFAMTATPVPRSTAQAFYGDIDLIQLDGKPPGRIKIVTEWIKGKPKDICNDPDQKIWADIKAEVEKGHQAFVVVPMVYDNKAVDAASVESSYKALKKVLPGVPIGYIHGQLKKDEQASQMEAFRNGETKILIGSTVIEVGVDIPNATRMIVLSADRLGASSLHQIRGRVGRSNLPSKCYLVSEGNTPTSRTRLQALVDSDDGFEIAKVDLKTRGEGDLFGLKQSGDSKLRFATLVDHSKLIADAQAMAKEIYAGPSRKEALRDAEAIIKGLEDITI